MAIFVDNGREPTQEEMKNIKIWLTLSEAERKRLLKEAEKRRKTNGK